MPFCGKPDCRRRFDLPQATVRLDMHFIHAVQIREFVECRAKVVRRTRSLVFMASELVVGSVWWRRRTVCGRRWGSGDPFALLRAIRTSSAPAISVV
jgi:hypothetical protein